MGYKIVGISNCPVGVAHTYMVAEALTIEGKKRGHDIKIETQGSLGNEFELTDKDIEEADYVILAIGRGLSDEEMKKFEGKRVIIEDITKVLKDTNTIFDNLDNATIYNYKKIYENGSKTVKEKNSIFKHIMTGVSYIIPLAIASGILLSISSILTRGEVALEGSYSYLLASVGAIGFELIVPLLGGYIAYSIADKPALVPALLGSYLIENKELLGTYGGGGFLGAIVVGILSGYLVKLLKSIKLPKEISTMMPFIIIPVVVTMIITTVVFYILGPILSYIMIIIMNFLNSLSSASSIIVCIIISIMIVIDMGGPINKTAYMFAFSMAQQGNYLYFGTVAIAAAIPTLSIGIATFIKPKLFNDEEVSNGKSTFIVGLFGITEPAIIYAVNDPKTILISQTIAAIVASIIGSNLGVQRFAPGANLLDPLLGNATPLIGFYMSIIVGVVINVSLIIFMKSKKLKNI